jgi:hypothetical protein
VTGVAGRPWPPSHSCDRPLPEARGELLAPEIWSLGPQNQGKSQHARGLSAGRRASGRFRRWPRTCRCPRRSSSRQSSESVSLLASPSGAAEGDSSRGLENPLTANAARIGERSGPPKESLHQADRTKADNPLLHPDGQRACLGITGRLSWRRRRVVGARGTVPFSWRSSTFARQHPSRRENRDSPLQGSPP